MVEVKIKLFANLREYHPDEDDKKSYTLNMEEGSTLKDLYKKLEIPEDEVKMTFINNLKQPIDYKLQEGDVIAIFPPIAGG